jgi:hypothetical protein
LKLRDQGDQIEQNMRSLLRRVVLLALVLGCARSDAPKAQASGRDSSKLGAGAPVRSAGADSAEALAAAWRQERDAINAEATAMDTLPPSARFTPAYAARFDALRRRAAHADSLRDHVRRWGSKGR